MSRRTAHGASSPAVEGHTAVTSQKAPLSFAKQFQLDPLTSDTCTRVLRILPSLDKSAPVQLEIEKIDLTASYEACSRLLDKRWFSRIWAIQEYALARKASFLLGDVVIDGDLLQELSGLVVEANLRGRSHFTMFFSRFRRTLALTKLPRLGSIRNEGHIDESQKLELNESLGMGWHHDCTDERDVIYSLQALVNYGRVPLRGDYNEPANLLARRISRKLVYTGYHDALFAGARGLLMDGHSDEPSWSLRLRPPFKFLGEERHWILSGRPTKYAAGGPKLAGPQGDMAISSSKVLFGCSGGIAGSGV